MAQYFIQEETLRQLGDAIREKTGSSEQMTPGQMVNAISNIRLKIGDLVTADIDDSGYFIFAPLDYHGQQLSLSGNTFVGCVGYAEDENGSLQSVFAIIDDDFTTYGSTYNTSGIFSPQLDIDFTPNGNGEYEWLIDPNCTLISQPVNVRALYI